MSTALTPRTTVVPLFQGDDYDAIADRLQAVERIARAAAPRRMAEESSVSEASREYDEYVEAALGRALMVRLVALGRKDYRALRNEHPPRMIPDPEGQDRLVPHDEDTAWGFNYLTFGDALLPKSIAEITCNTPGIAPDASTPASIETFLDGLSDGDFSRLYSAAITLNEGGGPDPKARLSTLLGPTSAETSESPARFG